MTDQTRRRFLGRASLLLAGRGETRHGLLDEKDSSRLSLAARERLSPRAARDGRPVDPSTAGVPTTRAIRA
jgi:hypothetical protein